MQTSAHIAETSTKIAGATFYVQPVFCCDFFPFRLGTPPRRSPKRTRTNFATCSTVSHVWKRMWKIWKIISPITWRRKKTD